MAKAEIIEGLDCQAPARDAIALVLRRRLDEMCSMRARALDFGDPEGVHDMRVSSRRLRSALRDFSGYLKKSKLSKSEAELKTLADALGAVRDADVAVLALRKIKLEAPPERLGDIDSLIAALEAKQKQAQRSLIPLLNQRKLNQLRRGFNKTVEAALTLPTTKKKSTEVTYYQLAASIVADRVSELRSLADSLYDPHRTKRLHRMRIAAKRLRYAVELFAPCLGDRSLAFARQIAQQQSALGCLHDCDVWIEYFGAWLSKENKGKGGHTESQRDAMVWLLGHFTKLRAKHFRAALSQWREWERKDFLNKLLNTRSGDAKIEARSQLVKAEGPNRLEHQAQTESPTRRPTRKRRNIPAATQLSVGTNDSDQNGSSAARSRRRRKEITPVKREMTLPELNSEEAVVNEQSRQNQTNATEEMPEVTHRVVKLEELTSEAATDEAAS